MSSRRAIIRTAVSPFIVGLISLAILAGGHPGMAAPVADAPAMAVAWKLDRAGTGTRLSFDLSRPLEATTTVVESPDRVIVDLPQVNFQIDPIVGHLRAGAGGLIRSFRFGLFAPGRSRIVIDLASPASVAKVGFTSIAGGEPARLSIDLTRTDRASFHKAAVEVTKTGAIIAGAPSTATQQTPVPGVKPVVVIDPGHGGIDPGASGLGGLVEKTVTADFATLLADKLTATGRYTVVLTRHDDAFVSLSDRVRIARESNAALFVSIHADTISANADVTGATVYTCSDRASDAEAARVAASENQADDAAGVQAAPDQSGVNDILFDLTRRETRTYAHLFQRTLVGYWQKIARLNKNPERAAGFKVLQAPDVPSVLLELGYLSSEKDVKALTSPEWREQATTSIRNAIDTFFAPRQAAAIPSTDATSAIGAPIAQATLHN